jgi:hypothetical protein
MSLYCSVSSFVLVAVVVKVVTTAISLACHGGHNDPRTRVGSRLPRGTDREAADSKIGYGLSDGDVLVMYDHTFYLFMHFYVRTCLGEAGFVCGGGQTQWMEKREMEYHL